MRLSRTATTALQWIPFFATATSAVTVPAAVDVAPSQYWEGNDGPWSSFAIQVGTPAQTVRVFISTASTSTWVVSPQGCQGTGIPSNCTSIRGGLFNFSNSTSWVENGPFGLAVENSLGYAADEGDFGFDTVGLGYPGSGAPTLNHTVVAWILTVDFFLGELGLNPRPTNFTTFNDPQTSFLSLLYEQSFIPSLSYSYTAGAQYRSNGVLGSLTLGGHDISLYVPNGISFDFYFDQTRDLTVALQAITASNGTGSNTLLPNGILTFIDSTVSQIWLPLEACQAFESAFGLVYDNSTHLYLVNDTQHKALLARNSSVTFTIGQTLSSPSAETVNITLPYASFDLEVSYPLVANTSRYFPLHRAANDTQYTLGRTFLQEAYLTVDYQRSNFSVSQRTWATNKDKEIINIFPPNSTTNSGTGNGTTTGSPSSKSNKLATGAIAGIVVGAVVILSLIAGAVWFCRRKKRREEEERKAAAEIARRLAEEPKSAVLPDAHASPFWINELGSPVKPETQELFGKWVGRERAEVDGTTASESRVELGDGEQIRHELEAPHGKSQLSGVRPVEVGPARPGEIGIKPWKKEGENEPARGRSETTAEGSGSANEGGEPAKESDATEPAKDDNSGPANEGITEPSRDPSQLRERPTKDNTPRPFSWEVRDE